MKVLRFILIVLALLVLLIVVLSFIGSKSYDVHRTATIDAPVDMVFPYLKSLEKTQEWGPWRDEDPEMEVTFSGDEGTVGSTSSWEGPTVGKGHQEVTAIEENKKVESDLTFWPPWGETKSHGYFLAEAKGDKTDVTWGFRGENGFFGRVFAVFMNMEEATGPMFATGLSNLNDLVEKDMTRKWNGYEVKMADLPERHYVGKRAKVNISEMQPYFAATYGKLMYALGRAQLEMAGMPSALYYNWDEEAGTTDLAPVAPLAEPVELAEFETTTIPAGPALQIDFYGSYDNLGEPHIALDSFSNNFDLEIGIPVIEEYVTDPSTEPDTSKWLTRITYPLD